jgi:tetratricopeptide (TPR) repeat protein
MAREARIDRLEEALIRVAEAQARADERLTRLEQAMLRAEERLTRLEQAMVRAEERLTRLEQAMLRAEERLTRLEQAMVRAEERLTRLEEAVAALAAAQTRTEERLGRLEEAVLALTQAVGRLSDTIGFTLEDLAREVTPPYLAQHYGIRVETLDRRFFRLDGAETEVDLYGEGSRDGERVAVVGEVRSRIHGRDVEGTVRLAARLGPQLPGTPLAVLFGFVIHPSAREAAARLGAVVISSSGR